MNGKNHLAFVLFLNLMASELLLAQGNGVPAATDFEAEVAEEALIVTPEAIEVDSEDTAVAGVNIREQPSRNPNDKFGEWQGYNSKLRDTTWITGKDFGMFSLEQYPTLKINKESAVIVGTGFHFLNGPVSPDMPARLFDFQVGFQTRQVVSKELTLDIKTTLGAFSDFEGSARKGIRFPGHVVSYYEWRPRLLSVFGVDVLDRDDISLLPVGGFVWELNENFVCECVFPRPSIQVRLDSGCVIYMGGELGGGTWATERSDFTNDNVTYRDYRATIGIRNMGHGSAFEIGWAFDRSLEFRSGAGNSPLDDAFLLRFRLYY